MAQGTMQDYLRLHGLDKPKAPTQPITLPEQPALGALARSQPIRGRNLPITIGSLAPMLQALRNLAYSGD